MPLPSLLTRFAAAAGATLMLCLTFGCDRQTVSSLMSPPPPPTSPVVAPGAPGPYPIFEQDYRLPPSVDVDILTDRMTELWGRLYMPSSDSARAPLPLLVFLHGNHETCGHGSNPRIDDRNDYTTSGTCPDGYVVTPNHRGYDYIARNMASWGFVVLSINANRGITGGAGIAGDSGLNLARGRLVLRHLTVLSLMNAGKYNSKAFYGIDVTNRINFDHVGLMGHSRGGEGVRAALAQYLDPGSTWPKQIGPMTVRGIYEIAPVDGQTSRTLNAMNTAWNVMIGLCDGDVSNFQGVRPFDRMLRETQETVQKPKSVFSIWGANHNFFNTEWQQSDSQGCSAGTPIFDPQASGSPTQQQIALTGINAFFRHYVGNENAPDIGRMLDPQTGIPASLAPLTFYGRDFVLTPDASQTIRLLDAANYPDLAAGSPLPPNIIVNNSGISVSVQTPVIDDGRKTISLIWMLASGDVTLPFAQAVDLSHAATLDLDLQTLNQADRLDFAVRLTDANGVSSSVLIRSALDLQGLPASHLDQTARLPLGEFTGVQMNQITGVQLGLDAATGVDVSISSIRASMLTGAPWGTGPVVDAAGRRTPAVVTTRAPSPMPAFVGHGAVVDASLVAAGGNGPDGKPAVPMVAVTVHSPDGFPTRSQLPVLHVNQKTYDLSGYASGSRETLIFQIPVADFKAFKGGEAVMVAYGNLAMTTYRIDAGTLSADIISGTQQ